MTEFESAISSSQATRSTKLSYIPILGRYERIELSSSRPQRNVLPLNQYLLVDPHRIELHPLVLQTSARTSYAKDPSYSVIQPNGGAKGNRTISHIFKAESFLEYTYKRLFVTLSVCGIPSSSHPRRCLFLFGGPSYFLFVNYLIAFKIVFMSG